MHRDLPLLLTIIWSVALGLLAQVFAHRWRMPAIVLLLVIGVMVGPSVLNIVQPSALGIGLPILVKLAVAIILFEGALNLRIRGLLRSAREIRNLVTIGVGVTFLLTTLTVRLIAGFDWSLAFLFGALMTVTGPTVVQPLLRRMRISRSIKTILEGEAILIDPIGAILAVAVLDIVLALSSSEPAMALVALWGYASRLVVGMIVGGAGAVLLSLLMRVPRLVTSELSNLVALAAVWTAFGVAESIQSEAGIMASVAMGLVLQNEAVPGARQLRRFKETLTTLSISVLFILLAANLKAESILAEGIEGVIVALTIMFVIRPVAVFVSTRKSSLRWQEKAMIAWIGPRGIIAASVASLFALTLAEMGHTDGDRLLALTFLVIIMTVSIQGLTASLSARLLGLQSLVGRKAVVIGASPFGRRIAAMLQMKGRPVVLVDTNRDHLEAARSAGFETVQGSALEQATLEQMNLDDVETVLAVTTNSEVNVLAAQTTLEDYRIRRSFPALNSANRDVGARLLEQSGGRLAFAEPIDIECWEDAAETIAEMTWVVPKSWKTKLTGSIDFPEELLPTVRVRGLNAEIVHAEQVWQPGDAIGFLLRMPVDRAEDFLNSMTDEN